MNETASTILWTSICWIVAFVVFACAKLFGKRGIAADSKRTEELERRAADNNSELEEAERRTREAIEAARAANRESDRVIREQAEDNNRAEANNRRASELLKRAEEIVNKNDN